ncbi:hypothetical protein H109_01682 [Trichophyton interdigitale MR816]|uniref:F-box domain-containing protein n=1 Tax=Trichophyton interdigitale (strain MR816) TaxID=1215338 RepID=A0A059JFE2_TRIIM|nr:hypothetical protein H101_04296 [Trichophyton interdigitale H6]KDB26519.1 hypothetical protein H109_01682 [Trichophyton interdigitale MR816]
MDPAGDLGAADDRRALLAYGQSQYAQRNYANALTAFTTALGQAEDERMRILDNRSATYCKLGDLDLALKDGRQMLKLDKSDARGYLRTAQVLQLKKRFEDALRLYEHALKSVDSRDGNRSKIEVLKAKLDRAINPPRRDPFSMFPPEIIAMVLQHFNVPTLLKLLRVSKRWSQLTVSLGQAFSRVDFTLARQHTVPFQAVRAYCVRHAKFLESVVVGCVTPQNASKTLRLLSRCPRLAEISLNVQLATPEDIKILHDFTGLKQLVVWHRELTFAEFNSLLAACPTLEYAKLLLGEAKKRQDWKSCSPAPQMRSLCLTFYEMTVTNPFFFDSSLKDTMPALEELEVSGVDVEMKLHGVDTDLSDHPSLCALSLSKFTLDAALKALPTRLEELTLNSVLVDPVTGTIPVYSFLNGLSKLRELNSYSLSCDIGFMLDGYFSALESSLTPDLTILNIAYCNITAEELVPFMKKGHLRSVTELGIPGIMGMNDSITEIMIDTMPSLKMLNLSLTEVTGYSIKLLADAPDMNVERILLLNPATPISRDAIEYGRSKGITFR